MDKLYVVGGRQRPSVIKAKEEWNGYDKGIILEVDARTHTSRVALDYYSPPGTCPVHSPSVLFKSATLQGKNLYACTSTEVLIYELPQFQRVGYISLPCFNDLHHVRPTSEGNLLVVATGLDMVVEVSPSGAIKREWGVLGDDPWTRFSRSTDYRLLPTTKPHRAHPNYVFFLGKEIWVTRCDLKDAVCLSEMTRRIDLGEQAHDGHVEGDYIYFTTVDGHILVVCSKTLHVEQDIDLNRFPGPYHPPLGWCRGLLRVDERRFWVGFTRIRKTAFKEKLLWAKHGGRDAHPPTRIALYDIASRQFIDEVVVERHGVSAVFSILNRSSPT